MKGLFLKDLLLLTAQKKLLVMSLALPVVFLVMNGGVFAIGYSALLFLLLGLSTLSCDEFEHGYAFLFTLPFTRRQYVTEKYLLCIGAGVLGLGLGVLVSFFFTVLPEKSDGEMLIASVKAFAVFSVLIPSLLIPFRIKYGSEHGRLISALIVGIAVALFTILSDLIPDITGLAPDLSGSAAAAILLCALLLLTALSLRISLRILERKEF